MTDNRAMRPAGFAEAARHLSGVIRFLRLQRGLTQVQAAQLIGHKTDRSWVRWEQGTMPDGYSLARIAQEFKTTPALMLGLEKTK